MTTLRIGLVTALVGLLVLGVAVAQKGDLKKDTKVVLPKVVDGARADLGKLAPDFGLKDLDGKEHSLTRYAGKIVVLEWMDPACQYCAQARTEAGVLREQPMRLKSQGVVWLTLNSTDSELDGGKPETNRAFVKKTELTTPLLLDADGAVGRAYGAQTTPHCFVINEKGLLVYKGALDNAPLGKVQGDQKKVNYVDAAITDIKAGRAVATSDTKPYGSTLKYRKTSAKR